MSVLDTKTKKKKKQKNTLYGKTTHYQKRFFSTVFEQLMYQNFETHVKYY